MAKTQHTLPGSAATDRQAIVLMLRYVEAECRRLGADDAARHAALAAALLPRPVADSVVN